MHAPKSAVGLFGVDAPVKLRHCPEPTYAPDAVTHSLRRVSPTQAGVTSVEWRTHARDAQ